MDATEVWVITGLSTIVAGVPAVATPQPAAPAALLPGESHLVLKTSPAKTAQSQEITPPEALPPESLTTLVEPTGAIDPAMMAESAEPALTSSAIATLPPVDPAAAEPDAIDAASHIGQVTSVTQLADVQPTDWAFQALQSLVERYGVIVGYPNGTFRGDRALSRYEFAAALGATLDRLTERLAVATDDSYATQADLATLQRLQAEFAAELEGVRGKVDALEARTDLLEAQQFSTTVVLNGQVTVGLAAAAGGAPPGLGEISNPALSHLTQLQLSGSFTGRDAFRVGLDASNFAGRGFAEPEALNTQMALLGYQSDSDNDIALSSLEYRFAAGDRLVFTVKPYGFSLNSVLSPNSLFSSASVGALSRFAADTPMFKIGNLDAGVGMDWLISDGVRLQVAYGARAAGQTAQGLFNSDHRAFGVQILTRPTETLTAGVAYINAFSEDGFLDTFTGSNNADTSGGFGEPAAIHGISGTLQWQVLPNLVFGAWGGATLTDSLPSDAYALSTTYLFSLGWLDAFDREGDLLGLMVGQPFRLRAGINIEREDEGSGLHYEAFYRYRINDRLAVIPGVFVVTDPGHIPENNTIVVGAVRTVFNF